MNLSKPQQLDAERALIHCLLDDPSIFHEISGPITPEMFFGLDNAFVLSTFINILTSGATPDFVLIKNTLLNLDQYEAIGGDAYFSFIDSTEYVKSNINEYVELIRDSYILRTIITAGTTIREAGQNNTADEAIDIMFSETNRILDNATVGGSSLSISDLLSREMELLVERLKNPGGDGYKTGLVEYDLITGGLHPTDEVIIAARPSVGKTALACRMLLNLAKQNIPTVMFSYEMSNQQLMQRLLSMESGVSLTNLRSGRLNEAEYKQVSATSKVVDGLPIYVYNTSSSGVSEIITETKKLIRTKGVKSIFVDYLQLMDYRVEHATQDLGGIVRRLKNLAIDGDINVTLLSQLNRMVEMRGDKIPILSDLRQSGNIEEHADTVLMLFREEMYAPNDNNRGKADLLIRKNRNGPIGKIRLQWNPACTNYDNVNIL